MSRDNVYFWSSLTVGLIILSGTLILVIKSFSPVYRMVLEFCGVVANTCQQAIQTVNPMGFIGLGALIWLIGVVVWQYSKTRMIVSKVTSTRLVIPSNLENLLEKHNLYNGVKLVQGKDIFCSGLIKPQVVIGQKIIDELTPGELEAVLVHESYHVKNHDPLKVFLTQVFAKSFFFLPFVSELGRIYLQEKELSADRLSAQVVGRKYLAKALLKVLSKTDSTVSLNPAIVPHFAQLARLEALRGRRVSYRFNSWSWVISIFVVTFLTLALIKPVLAFGGC